MSYPYSPNPDPYNRAPSPYRAPSPNYGMQPPASPAPTGQITAGTITYTTTTGPDGKIVYHPFRAVEASYQTPQGVVRGIQWVPAEATQILPAGAQPATAEFQSSWNRPGAAGAAGGDWQREEDRRRRQEDKEAVRREKERRKREKREEKELRDARERDRQVGSGIQRAGSPYGNPMANAGRISPYANPANLPPRAPSPYGAPNAGRPVSPYHGGGALPNSGKPVSPYHGVGALPGGGRPVSPYHGGGALPNRPVSPYHPSTTAGARPVSPYHGGGALPGGGARPVSPYHQGAALPGGNYGAGYTQAEVERKMADLGIGANNRQSADYGRKGPGGYPAAPGGTYPNTGYSTGPAGAYSSANANAGAHYSAASATSPYRSTSPMPPMESGRSGSPYRGPRELYPTGHVAEGLPRSRGPSPSPYGAAPPGAYPASVQSPNADQGMLPAPEGFSRPPNAAQSYTNFETMKISDMDDFMDVIPRMPLVLVPHDVYHEDWIRLMTDLASAWVGRLPIPESARANGRAPKRTTVASDLIDLWNSSFFIPRGVEIVMYKGRERRSGQLAGQVDMNLPGFEDDLDDISSTGSELTDEDSDLDDSYNPNAGRYGHQGGVYGRQTDGQIAELREAKRRRRALQEDEKRKKKEKKQRRRMRELERRYSVYLTCIPLPGVGYH